MKFTSSLAIAGMVALLGASAAMAQMTPAKPAAPAAPAADKMAISKACSDQANTKNLHGKERKKFREECKHNGGKPM